MSFSNPRPSIVSGNHSHWVTLDDGVGRAESDHPGAVNTQRPTGLYDPDPGQAAFPAPDYRPYTWELPLLPTPELRAPLPEEPEPPPLPDYNASLLTGDLFARAMREALDRPETQEPLEQMVSNPLSRGRIPENEAGIENSKPLTEPEFPPVGGLGL